MVFFSIASWKSGAAGRSSDSMKNGMRTGGSSWYASPVGHLQFTLEAPAHDSLPLLTAQIGVERVEKPRQKLHRVGLLIDQELPVGRREHRLHELVRET